VAPPLRDVQPPDHAPHTPLARLISENYQLAEALTRTLQNADDSNHEPWELYNPIDPDNKSL
jgi:hypothetical protein